jgi:hypothetical protein
MTRNKMLLSIALMVVAGVQWIVMPDVRATAQRTFVASAGLDTNACSLTQPCRSFVQAITQTNVGGEIIVQDSAGYGSVTVTKAISIISPPGIYAGVSVFGGFDGVTVNAPGATVVLRGLSINGQGGSTGVHLQQAARLRIESCVISNMSASGIAHNASGGAMIVLDTIVRDNLGTGILMVVANGTAVMDHVRIEQNAGDGLYIAPTPGSAGATATISDSVFTHNGLAGIRAETVGNSTASVQLERSILSNNVGEGFKTFVGAAPGAVVRFTLTRNAISENGGHGVLVLATAPGLVHGFLLHNSMHRNAQNGINADGTGAKLRVSQNVGQGVFADLSCINGASLQTDGNNTVTSVAAGTCYGTVTGF